MFIRNILIAFLCLGVTGTASADMSAKSDHVDTLSEKIDWEYYRVHNACTRDVYYLYASPVEHGDWGVDRLGSDILPSGADVYIDVRPGGCYYDFKAVFGNGDAVYGWGIDICEEPYVIIACSVIY